MAQGGSGVNKYSDILSNPNFYNWLKANLAIHLTRDGLEDYVKQTLDTFHETLLNEVFEGEETRTVCNQCTTLEAIKRSSKCFCKKLKEEIVKHHINSSSRLNETNPSSWYASSWEVAKCYLPKNYLHHTSMRQVDFNGTVGLMLNLDAFDPECKKFGAKKKSKTRAIYDKARNMSNWVRHTHTPNMDEHKMAEVIQSMSDLLICCPHDASRNAKSELNKLRCEDFMISSTEFTKLVKGIHDLLTTPGKGKAQKPSDTIKLLRCILDNQQVTEERHNLQQHVSIAFSKQQEKDKKRSDLKADLLVLNLDSHNRIPLQPVFGVGDTPVLEHHVEQRMSRVNHGVVSSSSQCKPIPISLKTLLDQEPGQDIYLVSKAGGGKTVFCKWLAALWCQAHGANAGESRNDDDNMEYIEAMKKYSYFFLITLRFSKELRKVDEMIKTQIIDRLSRSDSYTMGDLQSILHDENCLIVIDGIDEWTHPGPEHCYENDIPERNVRSGCTYITTSRPWKFYMLKKLSSLTMHIELQGLDESASKKFISNTLTKLCESSHENDVENCQKAISTQKLDRFTDTPLTLSFLVCLWKNDSKMIGNSLTEIYCNLVGHFLSVAYNKDILKVSPSKKAKLDLVTPRLIDLNDSCKQFYSLLIEFGKMAFTTFFHHRRESSLTFDRTVAEDIVNAEIIDLGLKIGFLTEEIAPESVMTRKVSFVHKTFQEFFAALYISSLDNTQPLSKSHFDKINRACKSLNNVLTVKHFYIFLFGLCPQSARTLEIAKAFCKTVGQDEYIHKFRRDMGSWNSFECYNKTAKDFQDLVVYSVVESKEIHGLVVDPSITLEDVIIDEDYNTNPDYRKTLEDIMRASKQCTKSIKVRGIETPDAFKNIICCLGGEQINSLVKIDCKCPFAPEDMDLLLRRSANTLECFVIKGGEWQQNKWVHTYFSVPTSTFSLFQKIQSIEELYLRNIKLSHGQLESLMRYVESRQCMKQIGLTFITCKDHEMCPCVSLDLSSSCQLTVLELGAIPLAAIELNTQSLETCYIGDFNSDGVFKSLMEKVANANKLECFRCGFLNENENKNNLTVLVETIPKLVTVKTIWLISLNLTQHQIVLSSEINRLENITMLRVLLQSESVENIKSALEELEQPVKVGLFSCGVSEEQEPKKFEDLKKSIKDNAKFRVLLDGTDAQAHHEYMFESIGKL